MFEIDFRRASDIHHFVVNRFQASMFDLNTREQEILPEMKFARGSFTPISGGNYIYVFGGYNGSGRIKSCER